MMWEGTLWRMTIENECLTLRLTSGVIMSICARTTGGLVCPIHQDCIFGVSLNVLLQILGPLEGLAAKFAAMGFQGNMDSNMRRDMITLDHRYGAVAPGACQIQVICALATDVGIAYVVLEVASMSVFPIPNRDFDVLHRVTRGCQPSSHSRPIGKHSYHCRCSQAELLIAAAAAAMIAPVGVALAIGTAAAEAAGAEAGAVTVAGDVVGGMVDGHDADKLAVVAAIAGAGTAAVAVAVAVVHVEKCRLKGQWRAGLGPGLVPRTWPQLDRKNPRATEKSLGPQVNR